ncbi:hypothetical protein L0Y59_01670 [Candidatus Uhrbacteria bacterium]|nr:hypothetical protein [Candidatus Uhrbacteria bacterium]
MADPNVLRGLCLDETGAPKPKNDCRVAIINFLILEEMMDIDDAEDLAEKTLRETGFWPEPDAKDVVLKDDAEDSSTA